MGKWGSLGVCALIAMLMSHQALAQCASLRAAITIAGSNLGTQNEPDQQDLEQMVREIGSVNNDALLTLLRSSGQAQSFGDLRSFLTQLKFLVQAADETTFVFTEEMQQDLVWSNQVITAACDAPTTTASLPAVTDRRGVTGPLGPVRNWVAERHRMLRAHADRVQLHQQLGTLGGILTGLFALIVLVVTARLGLRLLRKARQRGVDCQIRAEFRCMMQEIPVQITFVSPDRCSFVPLAEGGMGPITQISAGTFCTLSTPGADLGAQMAKATENDFVAAFRPALSKAGFRALIALSDDIAATGASGKGMESAVRI